VACGNGCAVLAFDDGSRKVTDADIDVDVSKALPDERIAIGPEAQTSSMIRALIPSHHRAFQCPLRLMVP
jgi:hypothetical protein